MMNVPLVKRLCSIGRASSIALALCLFAPGLLYAAPVTQIFVLHSYSQEYPWTQSQHEGFIQALSEDAQVNAAVTTEYLDTKRHTYDQAYTRELTRHLQIKYKDYKPAAIYVTDDNALLFARDHLNGVFPGTPVFFSGVNDYGVQNSLDPSLFTGVFENKEVAPNLEWLLRLDKDANDLIFIGDGSNTYQAIERQARNDLIPYRLRATFIAEKRMDRAMARLKSLPGEYLFLTTLGGMVDANGQVLPLRDIIRRLVFTGRIIISMEDAYIVEGVLGGFVTNGRSQGMNAARLLLAHLHGKPVVSLPPMIESPNVLIFDDRSLQQLGIDLPESLRDQAVILNPRPGFYDRHRTLILGSLIGLAVLLFLVVTGAFVILTRKNRELGLARSSAETANTLFNQLAEQSRTVHWEINAEGMFTQVGPMSYSVLGYRPEELVNKKHLYDLFPEKQRDANKTAAFKLFARKEPFHGIETQLLTKDGQLIWTLASGIPVLDDLGTLTGYRGSDRDITDRKQAERALIESEERFQQLFDHMGDGVAVYQGVDEGQDFVFVDINRAAQSLSKISRNDAVGRRVTEVFPGVGRIGLLGTFRRVFRTGRPEHHPIKEYVDGRIRQWVENYVYKLPSGLIVAIFSDTTEKYRAEETLLKSEMRFRGLVESSSDLIWEVNKEGVYTYVSPKVEEMLGYSPEEVIGKSPFDLMPPEEAGQMSEQFLYLVKRGEPFIALENVNLHKNGRRVVLETSGVPMFDASGNVIGYHGVDRDITERKQAEAEQSKLQTQLIHAQKMEAISTLAGGIAHRFNNALSVITGNIDLLEMDFPGDKNITVYTNEVKASTHLMALLTAQLLTYARGGKYQAETVSLSDFIKDTILIVKQTTDSVLNVETDLPADILNVKADRVQMQMVLSAVLTNASEAMKGKGCIRVTCRNEIITEQNAGDFPGFKPGAYACLTITDDGEGMNEETVRRVFEPFFTTKFKGRGLGMAAAYGFVRNHNGHITVDSESGKGTTVTIYLPAA